MVILTPVYRNARPFAKRNIVKLNHYDFFQLNDKGQKIMRGGLFN